MALDRQSIEKKDFPIGAAGYEPDAVDAHLRALAERDRGAQARPRAGAAESLAATASEQVRAILEAAETQRGRDRAPGRGGRARDPRRGRPATRAATRASRPRAGARPRRQGRAGDRRRCSQRLDAMESELGALFESLRAGAEPPRRRPRSCSSGNLDEVRDAVAPRRASSPSRRRRRAAGRRPRRGRAVGAEVRDRGRAARRRAPPSRPPRRPRPTPRRRATARPAEPRARRRCRRATSRAPG